MISVLYGPNTFEAERALSALLLQLVGRHPGTEVERLDAAELQPAQLPDILQGISMFNDHRIIVLRAPSTNKPLWTALEPYLSTVTDTTDLVIVDAGIDKRTKTYKALQAVADMHEYSDFGPRNSAALEQWLASEAKRQGLTLTRETGRLLIDRAGYDQWVLAQAIEKLSLLGEVTPERIKDVVEPSPSANAFELFERALKGETESVRAMISDLQVTNDPHALIGLLGTQCYQLALVAHSSKTPVELGKLIGSSPYPLQKLSPVVRRLSKAQVKQAIDAMAECDRDLKHSVAPPWTLITRALLKISAHAH